MRKKSKIALWVLCVLSVSMFSCKKKKICAAYNSSFVYDETNLATFFAPFGNDSTPGDVKIGRFNDQGLVTKPRRRNDKELLRYEPATFKEAAKNPIDSLTANPNDSMGAIISVKELFPEKVNTDQEAYDHYVGDLLKQYQKDKEKPEAKANKGSQTPDSTAYYNNPPEGMTKEEQKAWKEEKKAYKKRKKERERREKEEARQKEEEDANKEEDIEEEEFDFDL